MNKILTLFIFFLVLATSCKRVPLTGRRQVALIPAGTMQSMAYAQYGQFMQQNKVVTNTAEAQMLARVGQKVSQSVEDYLKSKNLSDRTKGFKWEFKLVESPQVNAWCMPGGKVAFYTGILPYSKDESGMAAIMGHEVAHAIAKHGNERMTQALGLQLGAAAGAAALSVNNPQHINTFNQLAGYGGQLGILAFSRKHELEADRMGMIFMAKAGYHPKEAIEVWKRMAAKGGAKPPEFLSTHPHESTRITNLQTYMKEALVFYRPR
jgi:predicted Zn-dependent protease